MWTRAIVAGALLAAASLAFAGPGTITYQGCVLRPDGSPVADHTYPMRFKIYDVEAGGTHRWQETDVAVSVVGGWFSTTLGDGTSFGSLFAALSDLWLEVAIDLNKNWSFEAGETYAPRQKMTAAAWAMEADTLDGKHASDFGTIKGVTAGTGLVGGGASGNVALSADTGYLQRRVTGAAPVGQFIQTINEDGTVLTSAAITAIAAGAGLTGGGTSGSVTLSADPTYLQRRITGTSPLGQFIQTINEDGTVVTSSALTAIAVGAGLIGGGTSGPVALSVLFGGNGIEDSVAHSDHFHLGSAWSLTGNAGTTSGTIFLGTTDNVALDLRANNSRALRIEPHSISPSLIGGHRENSIGAGVFGATIAGGGESGAANRVTGSHGAVTGGYSNVAGRESGIGGGTYNTATGRGTVVAGGQYNFASADYGSIVGGSRNTESGYYGAIGGGYYNLTRADYGTIAGGCRNIESGYYGAVGGGYYNFVSADCGTIAGGSRNVESGYSGAIGGGYYNLASADYGTIAGGYRNIESGYYGAVGGGYYNTSTGNSATVAGGANNNAGGSRAAIGGGDSNAASAGYATVGGGQSNSARGDWAMVGGGYNNTASAIYATVGGGYYNTASADRATVGGGYNNTVSAIYATVGGGCLNSATGSRAAVAGGSLNTASALHATICGGYANTASASYTMVLGGRGNTAGGDYSLAGGRRAKALGRGSFAWADSTDADFDVGYDNRFGVRASGGVYLYTSGSLTAGAYLAAGSGTWAAVSDRDMKENFVPTDGGDVLEKLAAIPISTWNYKTENRSIRHMGPMAQDLHTAFALGDSDKAITTIDADGVALAAIKGLHELLKEKDAEIAAQQEEIAALQKQNGALESRVAAVEARIQTIGQH